MRNLVLLHVHCRCPNYYEDLLTSVQTIYLVSIRNSGLHQLPCEEEENKSKTVTLTCRNFSKRYVVYCLCCRQYVISMCVDSDDHDLIDNIV